ncbi:hypothetical protein LIA77_06654 [Sarocladium implicatum]|nr:hypothetical protein LIA77_06654 [Sarocladium implicatum]
MFITRILPTLLTVCGAAASPLSAAVEKREADPLPTTLGWARISSVAFEKTITLVDGELKYLHGVTGTLADNPDAEAFAANRVDYYLMGTAKCQWFYREDVGRDGGSPAGPWEDATLGTVLQWPETVQVYAVQCENKD